MLTAPGAGTNTDTGSAHQDAFNDLAEREAAEIAAVLDAGLFAPILDQWHPGQPHLVEFVMRRPDSDNASGAVANITALAGAGYRPSAEQVSELTGLDVEDKAPEGSEGDWTNPQGLPRRGEGTMGGARVNVSLADFIHEDADTLADGMLAAVAGVRSTNAEEKRHPGTGTPCHAKGKCPLEDADENKETADSSVEQKQHPTHVRDWSKGEPFSPLSDNDFNRSLQIIEDGQQSNVKLCQVTDAAADLYEKAGLTLARPYHAMMHRDFCLHALAKHGNAKVEAKRGQLPITKEDCAMATAYVRNPDSVTRSDDKKCRRKSDGTVIPRYHIEKEHEGVVYTVIVEELSGKKGLSPVTMYKRAAKKDKKKAPLVQFC